MPNRLIELFKPDYWLSFFSENLSTWDIIVNLLDIFVVWFLIYRLFELVRGTKAVQLLKGVAIFIGIRIAAVVWSIWDAAPSLKHQKKKNLTMSE